jgi:hypothetical protein
MQAAQTADLQTCHAPCVEPHLLHLECRALARWRHRHAGHSELALLGADGGLGRATRGGLGGLQDI